MKKILLIFLFGTLLSILIYNYTVNKKIDVLIIGDSVATGDTIYGNSGISYNLFLKEYLTTKKLGNYDITYTKNNMTIRDFNYQIVENNEINDKHLQSRIKSAEIIIISLGQDELTSKSQINGLKNTDRKEFYEQYKEMLNSLRNITQKKVYIIGFYGNIINQLQEIEKNIQNIALNQNCQYIRISDIIKNNDYFDNTLLHLNYEGHKKIFNQIKKEITSVIKSEN